MLGYFETLNPRVIDDYERRAFEGFKPLGMDEGTPVETIEEPVIFDLVHRGIHTGALLALRGRLE